MSVSSHAEICESKRALSELVRFCTSPETSGNLEGEIGNELKEFPILDVAKCLEATLVSNDSASRRLAVTTLSWIVLNTAAIAPESLPELLSFFCGRLSDWASVEPSLHAIRAIYDLHLSPGLCSGWEDSEAVLDTDTAELSALLGTDSFGGPLRNWSLTSRVLRKILIHVHAPSFGKSVRLEVQSLFLHWLTEFESELSPLWPLVSIGLTMESEDERDPDCLLLLFQSLTILATKEITNEDELFETCLSSYFSSLSDDTSSPLFEAMRSAFIAFGVRSVAFLLPFLNDPRKSEAAFVILSRCTCSMDDLMVAELHKFSEIPRLLGELWKKIEINSSFFKIFENRLDIALLSAQENMFAVLSWAVESGNWEFVETLLNNISDEQKFDENWVPLTRKICKNLDSEKILLILPLVSMVEDANILKDICGRVSRMPNCSSTVIASMFEFHSGFALAWELDFLKNQFWQDEEELFRVVTVLFQTGDLDKLRDLLEFVASTNSLPILNYSIGNIPNLAHTVKGWNLPRYFGVIANNLPEDEARVFAIDQFQSDLQIVATLDNKLLLKCLENENVEKVLTKIFDLDEEMSKKSAEKILALFPTFGGLLARVNNPAVWVAGMRAVAVQIPESDLIALVRSQGSLERYDLAINEEYFVQIAPKLEPNLPSELRLRALACIAGMDESHEPVLLETVCGSLLANRLVAKYIFGNKTLSEQFVKRILQQILSKYSLVEAPSLRFSSMQLLAVVPEIVPAGKLGDEKILRFLKIQLNLESKKIVRKQISMAITNWINLH